MSTAIQFARWAIAIVVLLIGFAMSLSLFVMILQQTTQAPAVGSGGIGAVSAGIAEGLFELASFITAQVALRMAMWRGVVGRRVPRWHLIGSAGLWLFWMVASFAAALTSILVSSIISLLVVAGQLGIAIGAIVLMIRGPRKRE